MAKIFVMRTVTVITMVVFAMAACSGGDKGVDVLDVFCGAGLMKPMEEIRMEFGSRYGVDVVVHYGGSGELLGQLALEQTCDVFIPGAKKYIGDAAGNGWIADGTVRDIARHIPVIAVASGNPKEINTLDDMTKPGVTVALGDPDACAIGRLAREIFEKNALVERIRRNIKVRAPTVNQLLLYVALGQADAAIIWEDMALWAQGAGELTIVPIPDERNVIRTVSTAVTTRSRNRGLAERFNEFVVSDEARSIWTRWGFDPCVD
ncbi:MAG: molybdate ABC transporter substrate-binding protein [Candidatus Hydrogenedentota bacterium]|nr:MAG: molybdate ABC transporter substrate-binding protein [Candidatus Hydrogenedentota bacterium]